jgi:geranylgeranyl diphosphate synthase, type II
MTHSATLTTMSFSSVFNASERLILDTPHGIALSSNENRAFSIRFRPVNLKKYLRTRQKVIDRALDRYLPKTSTKPVTLHKAMRYSLFAGGKRLRPILCLAAAEACRGNIDNALPLGCAVECIHTYSLVHDDLPSMDNDDFRRGRPTCHKVFGDGIAVLAGDALLTIAFEIVSNAKPATRYDISILLREIAVAAGSQKLIAGQVADLEAEGKRVKRDQLRFIHENKTAAMLKSSVRLGAMSANADARKLSAITKFGERLGLAFQVIDDILDVTQTSEILGKSAGKDVAAKKATYPAVIGLEKSRGEARRLTRQAHEALSAFREGDAEALHALANYLLEREY